jgi:hypothetical protein
MTDDGGRWAKRAAPAVALFAVVLAVYARGLNGPFLYDDRFRLVENPATLSVSAALKSFGRPEAIDSGNAAHLMYRPALPVAYASERAVFGLRPWAFHLVNVSLHGGAAVLVYVILAALTGGRGAAWAAALWWAVHPAHVEAVQYVSSLADVLCGVGVLASVWLYVREKRRWALLPFLLALLAKEAAVAAPAAIFALAFWRADGEAGARARAALRAATPFLAVAAGFVVLRASLIGLAQAHTPVRALSVDWPLVLKAFFVNLRVAAFPVELRPIYNLSLVRPLDAGAAAGAIALAALAALAIGVRRRVPAATVGAIWFAAFMLPVSNLIPIRVLVAERFLYLPLVGAALAGAAFWQVLPRPRAKAAAVGAMIALLTALAVARLGAWTDESVFWRDAVRTAPDSFTAAEALGACYFREHRWAEAEAVFRQMVREHPEDAGAAYALATFYFNTQRFSEAQAVFERLVQLDPANPTYRAGVRQSRAASEESEGK